jgi:SAM-dependent methyltransferase
LDLGSGVGDVALIAAQLVGPSGAVVGIERDARSVERARARTVEAGLVHVTFVQSDADAISSDEPFDAVVGRYILMFLPDPVAVLRSLARFVRPEGVLAFQEPDWTSFLEEAARLPLWSVAASLLVKTLQQCGTNTDMGSGLSRVFHQAGLPSPTVRSDCLIGSESWLPDCLHSVRPTMLELGFALDALGDFNSLHERLSGELSAFKARTPLASIVSAWSRNLATSANEPEA